MNETEALATVVAQARAGDLEAFDALVRRFQDMAVGYAYSLLNDFSAAQDAAQEAFIQLHADLPQLRAPEAFVSWFRRIIFKQCDRLRRGKRPEFVPLDTALPARDGHPAAQVDSLEVGADLHRALLALPEEERAALVLFHFQDASLKDLSEFLGLTPSAADHRLRAARRHLKERLLTMLHNDLQANRPSNDTRFLRRVMDSLTGLANRQGLAARLDEEIEISRATGGGFGLALIDVDHYMHINATLGHVSGDALLAALAWQIQPRLGAHDFAARFGGDELGVIIRRATRQAAWALADAFRQTVAETEFRLGDLLKPEARHIAAAEPAETAAANEFQIGLKYLRANALSDAAAAFQRAQQADPRHTASEMELAYVLARQTKDAAALAEPVRITLTGGLAWHQPDDTADSLIARADKLLEAAKAAGRNRIGTEA